MEHRGYLELPIILSTTLYYSRGNVSNLFSMFIVLPYDIHLKSRLNATLSSVLILKLYSQKRITVQLALMAIFV